MIRIGLCTDFEFVPDAAALGFDYLELSLREIAALKDAEFEELRAYVEYHRLPIDVLREILPDALRITGDAVSARELHAYFEKAFARAQALDTKVIVMDALASRNVPAGFDFPQAWRQLDNFLRLVQRHAKDFGLCIAVKSFRKAECNLLNHVSEAALLCSLLQFDNVGIAADTVQMALSAESPDALRPTGNLLMHVQTGNALSRELPKGGDGEDYEGILTVLKECGYQGRISCIAQRKYAVVDASNALQRMRAAHKAVFGK